MASGVVKVARRSYAVGLFWQPSPSGRIAQAAREAALQPGQKADYYCVRAASKSVAVPQYGLGQSALGHKVGMPTLAASIANVQPGSWAGAFRMREGTWVIVVRDDLVAPDGDILFESDDAARERLLQEISLGGVQRIYAPDAWSIPGSDPTPIPLLLQDHADCRLQPVQLPIKLLILGGGAIAVVLIAVVVGLQMQAEQERQERERIAAEQRKKAGALASLMEEWKWPPAEECYAKVWEEKPTPSQVLDTCREAFKQVHGAQYGWKRGATICQNGSLGVTWTRDSGNKPSNVPAGAIVNDQITIASQSTKSPGLQPRGAQEVYGESVITSSAITKGWPAAISRLPDDPPKLQPPSHVKKPPPPPPSPWRKRGIRYSGKAPPWEWRGLFEHIPGFIIQKIIWDGKGWTMEALIYEKRGG
jgi:hypothetical protein